MENKLELVLNKSKETVSSLELVKYLNKLREVEYKHKQAKGLLTNPEIRRGHYVELKHKTMLSIINDEFEEEIGRLIFQQSYYTNSQNKQQPMFELNLDGIMQLGAKN